MHIPFNATHKPNGFTFIELVLVLAIVGILVAVISVPFMRFRQQQALQNSTSSFISLLNDARTKTLASVNNSAYSVKIDSDQATLFVGNIYDVNASTNEVTQLETPVTVTATSLNGGGTVVTFDRLTGSTSQYGTITVALPDATSKTITVTSTGAIMRN